VVHRTRLYPPVLLTGRPDAELELNDRLGVATEHALEVGDHLRLVVRVDVLRGGVAEQPFRDERLELVGNGTQVLDSPGSVDEQGRGRGVCQERLVAFELPLVLELPCHVGEREHGALEGTGVVEQGGPRDLEYPALPVGPDDAVSHSLDRFARVEHLPERELLVGDSCSVEASDVPRRVIVRSSCEPVPFEAE
jgi:hypothetical protein